MVLRFTGPTSRAAILVLASFAALALSFFGIRNAFASHAAGLDTLAGYERAVHLEPGNARNWYLLGRYWQYNIEDPDPQRAIAYYRHSLSISPHSAAAWLDLASVYDGEGQTREARDAFLSAKRAYPSSADVAWRYGNFLLRQNSLAQAFEEIHLAVAADPRRAAEGFSRCWRVKRDAQAILDSVIPPSKDAYVAILHDLAASRQIDPALAVWERLVSLHPRMSPAEIGTFTNVLLQDGRLVDIQVVWQQAVAMMPNPPPADPPGSVIWDGGFESGLVGDGLAWQFPKERNGVLASIDRSQKHSGNQSLRLLFSGKENVSYVDACHYAVVEPGVSYRLSGWVQTRGLDTNEGVRLRLWLFGKGGGSAVETTDLHGSAPWTKLSLLWTAPQDAKLVNVCVARRAGSNFEENIEGSAWVDDVSLVPVLSGTSKP